MRRVPVMTMLLLGAIWIGGCDRKGCKDCIPAAPTVVTPPAPAPPSCTYILVTTTQVLTSYLESAGSVLVRTEPSGATCSWTAVSHAPWITITSGASGTGQGNVHYNVAVNNGGNRTGTITIAGHTFTVAQHGR